jgi:uncharacterized protein (DUF1015 family)
MIEADGTQHVLGFGTASDQTWQLARFHCAEEMAMLAPEHSHSWRELAVAYLHVLVLDQRLKAFAPENQAIRFVHLLQEVTEAVTGQACDLAVLVPPVTMKDVQRIASQREKMPPKSTYFYPKLLSGLVFNSLSTS